MATTRHSFCISLSKYSIYVKVVYSESDISLDQTEIVQFLLTSLRCEVHQFLQAVLLGECNVKCLLEKSENYDCSGMRLQYEFRECLVGEGHVLITGANGGQKRNKNASFKKLLPYCLQVKLTTVPSLNLSTVSKYF